MQNPLPQAWQLWIVKVPNEHLNDPEHEKRRPVIITESYVDTDDDPEEYSEFFPDYALGTSEVEKYKNEPGAFKVTDTKKMNEYHLNKPTVFRFSKTGASRTSDLSVEDFIKHGKYLCDISVEDKNMIKKNIRNLQREGALPKNIVFGEGINFRRTFVKTFANELDEKIVKKGNKWQVQSEKGKNLGTYDTKKEAEDRLKQVHYFKHMNEDIQETDNEGNILSKEQIEFFKNSKVRDNQGRLLVCYHGTNSEFDIFDKAYCSHVLRWGPGFYFLSHYPNVSPAYGKIQMKCYLNITNPFIVVEGQFEYASDIELSNKLVQQGYDGIIDYASDCVVVFESNQIKSIDNKNPTNSDNINEIYEGSFNDIYSYMKSIKSNAPKLGPAFILSDGSFVNLNNEHSEIFGDDDYDSDDYYTLEDNYNIIKINGGNKYELFPYIDLWKIPNKQQENSILDWMYYLIKNGKKTIMVNNGDFSEQYQFSKMLPEEIIKDCYRRMNEDLKLEKVNESVEKIMNYDYDDDIPVAYVISSDEEMINFINNYKSWEQFKILYDPKKNWYIVGDPWDNVHYYLLQHAVKAGYYPGKTLRSQLNKMQDEMYSTYICFDGKPLEEYKFEKKLQLKDYPIYIYSDKQDSIEKTPFVRKLKELKEEYNKDSEDFPFTIKDIENEFSDLVSTTYESCGNAFILPDGRFLLTGKRFNTHADFAFQTLLNLASATSDEIYAKWEDDDTILEAFTEHFNLIRINDGSIKEVEHRAYFVVPGSHSTMSQLNSLKEFIEYCIDNKYSKKLYDISAFVRESHRRWELYNDLTADDIMKDVKRAMISGHFYEGLKKLREDFEEPDYSLDDIVGNYSNLISDHYESCGNAFIMPDGDFILSGKVFPTHAHFIDDTIANLSSRYASGEAVEYDSFEFCHSFDLIRVNDGSKKNYEDRAYFVIEKRRITAYQLSSLREFVEYILDNRFSKKIETLQAFIVSSHQMWDLTGNITVDDIMDGVKSALLTGHFLENLKEDKINNWYEMENIGEDQITKKIPIKDALKIMYDYGEDYNISNIHLFHGTTEDGYKNILKDGMIKAKKSYWYNAKVFNNAKMVYLTVSESDAAEYVFKMHEQDAEVIQIDINKLDLNKLYVDCNEEYECYEDAEGNIYYDIFNFVYLDDIPLTSCIGESLTESKDKKVILYHGSQSKDLKFLDNYPLYLTDDKELAISFANGYNFGGHLTSKDCPTVYKCEVSVSNPYIIKSEEEYEDLMDISNYETVIPQMINNEYDSMIYKSDEGFTYYVVFNPSKQVKILDKEFTDKCRQLQNINESKADWERFRQWAGDDLYNRFISMKDRLKNVDLGMGKNGLDIYYWMKKGSKDWLRGVLDSLESTKSNKQLRKDSKEGAELLYNKNELKVFKVNNAEASRLYGKNTEWCISSSGGYMDDAEDYFYDLKDNNYSIYFFITSNSKVFEQRKVALTVNSNKSYWNIYDEIDYYLPCINNFPKELINVIGIDASKPHPENLDCFKKVGIDWNNVDYVYANYSEYFEDQYAEKPVCVRLKDGSERVIIYWDTPGRTKDVTEEWNEWLEEEQ